MLEGTDTFPIGSSLPSTILLFVIDFNRLTVLSLLVSSNSYPLIAMSETSILPTAN